MRCKPIITLELADAIQLAEDHINAQRESIIAELTSAVIAALVAGIELKNIKITEVTTWTDKPRQANYTVVVEDKITGRKA